MPDWCHLPAYGSLFNVLVRTFSRREQGSLFYSCFYKYENPNYSLPASQGRAINIDCNILCLLEVERNLHLVKDHVT